MAPADEVRGDEDSEWNPVAGWPAWLVCAAGGAAIILAAKGLIGVVVLLTLAVWEQRFDRVLGAVALVLVCLVSGGSAGLVYYGTRKMRHASTLGRYASWILIAELYLLIATVCIVVVGSLVPGLAAPGDFLSTTFVLILGGVGLLAGVIFAWPTPEEDLDDIDPPAQPLSAPHHSP